MVGFATIILMHILVTYAVSRSQLLHRWLASPPRRVVEEGKLVLENLQREWMRPETVQFELRLDGEEHLRDIQEARLEPRGTLSVLKAPSSKPVQKKDMRLLR